MNTQICLHSVLSVVLEWYTRGYEQVCSTYFYACEMEYDNSTYPRGLL